jgi:hypothetical protein
MLKKLAKKKSIIPVWVNNKPLKEKVGGSKCIIKKTPSLEYGAELADREIEIQVFDYTVE